jgi:uncharacterized protein
LLGLTLLVSTQALEVPFHDGRWVTDDADLMPPEAEQRLELALDQFHEKTGAQVVVLTIPSLEGDPVEDFSLRVAEKWRIGRGDVDDGVLFLIARDDRKLRLEVGYGLEATLTDATTRRILEDVVRPRFRAGDFAAGIEAGTQAVMGVISGQADLPPPGSGAQGGDSEGLWVVLFLVGVFSLQALSAPGPGSWVLYLLLMPFWGFVPGAFFGARGGLLAWAAWAVGFPLLRRIWPKSKGGGFRSGGGGFGGPFLGGGSGGGWSSGGGGFSGGGGSFGGGGASSSW